LIAAAGVNGKTMTCYPELEPDLRAAGAVLNADALEFPHGWGERSV